MEPTEKNKKEEAKKQDTASGEKTASTEKAKADTSASDNAEKSKGGGFNPLDEAVTEKDYSNPFDKNGGDKKGEPVKPIAEPKFTPPPIDDKSDDKIVEKTEGKKEPILPPNPALAELSTEEKNTAATQLADVILDGYKKLHELGQWYVSIDQEDLSEKAIEGKIDLDMKVPTNDEGTEWITVKEFVDNYNKQSKQALRVDEDWEAKVRPVMIRVFVKHGWGLSDEQYLIYMLGRDITEKAVITYTFKKTINKTMALFEKTYQKILEQNSGAAASSSNEKKKESNVQIVKTENSADDSGEMREPEERK